MKSDPTVADLTGGPPSTLEGEFASLSVEILERYEELSMVYRLSDRLGAVLGRKAVARLVLEEAVQVLRAKGGELWLRQDDDVERVAAVGVVPSPLQAVDRVLHEVIERAKPHLQEPRAGLPARLIVPLPAPAGRPIGAVVLRERTDGTAYRTGDVKLLSALATLTSAFLRNHQLAEQAREADVRRRDGELARQIHRSLLPSSEADCPAVETAGVSHSAEKIGGDCYDYLQFADGSLGILIADVSGHGVAAAMYMAAARGALHAEARRSSDPAELLQRTNVALNAMFEQAGMYATAFLVRVSADGRDWSYSGAGHPAALCLRGDGLTERLESLSTALGLFEDTDFETRHITLTPEDRLVLYTDGFTEARSSSGKFYGVDRLTRVALEGRDKTVASLRQQLLADLEGHTDHRGVADDVTLVLAQPCGGPA